MPVAYRIEKLTKIYKKSIKKANDELTLHIHEGEIFGLLGPNGAGKSTLVNQIAGLVRPTSGSIHLYGIDVIKRPGTIPNYVALQAQNTQALDDLYPEEALFFTAQLRGMTATAARKQTADLTEELDLGTMSKKRLKTLSGGQRQLVNLAVAMVGQRPIMIFDEPTNNLDPAIRRQIWEKLLNLNKQGATIILVTHNVLEAERVIGRLGIINNGQLLAIGTPGELKARVDQRVRLELLLKTETIGYDEFLQSLGDARALTQQHWHILCQRDHLQPTIDKILAHIGLPQLDDFRILTPSLEDVYLQLSGGTNLSTQIDMY
jgi:ABC-type multidrug transport system ATPase subunit